MQLIATRQDFWSMYQFLCSESGIVELDEWIEALFEDEYFLDLEAKMESAIARGDDYLFGFESRDAFREAVWTQQIQDHTLQPEVTYGTVVAALDDYIATHQIVTWMQSRTRPVMVFPPVKGVW